MVNYQEPDLSLCPVNSVYFCSDVLTPPIISIVDEDDDDSVLALISD